MRDGCTHYNSSLTDFQLKRVSKCLAMAPCFGLRQPWAKHSQNGSWICWIHPEGQILVGKREKTMQLRKVCWMSKLSGLKEFLHLLVLYHPEDGLVTGNVIEVRSSWDWDHENAWVHSLMQSLIWFKCILRLSIEDWSDCLSSWWFQHIWKILVKFDHFPR